MNKIKLIELFNIVDLQPSNLFKVIKNPLKIKFRWVFYKIDPILPPSTLIDAPFVPDARGLDKYKIVLATSETVRNLSLIHI